MADLLKVENLSVNFGGVHALSNLSFLVEEGELLGLLGPNGAGKTTAMRCITGITTPSSGIVRLKGKDLNRLPVHRRVRLGLGMSQQLVRPFKSISLVDNVALAAGLENTKNPLKAMFLVSRKSARETALELLEKVGIADLADSLPGKLPLGFLKRLEVARALALKPDLLLLDEPLAGLNQNEAGRLADMIKDLNKSGQSIVLIEHNLGEVMRICSRVVVLDNGELLATGMPRDVMKDPHVREAYLGGGHGHA